MEEQEMEAKIQEDIVVDIIDKQKEEARLQAEIDQ